MRELMGRLEEAWALLAGGVADPASAWRVLTLANVNAKGGPGLRSVVLRGMEAEARVAVVHTDLRSPKISGLARDPRAALLGWDAARRVQIRLDGMVEVAGAGETDAAWAALGEGSRTIYAGALAPGMPLAEPEVAMGAPDRAVFAVLRLRIMALEYLSLAHGAHRRARFDWADGAMAATWLVP